MATETWIKCRDGEWRAAKDIAKSEARKRYREPKPPKPLDPKQVELEVLAVEYVIKAEATRLRNLANHVEWAEAGDAVASR
jgi:hypothetical protein